MAKKIVKKSGSSKSKKAVKKPVKKAAAKKAVKKPAKKPVKKASAKKPVKKKLLKPAKRHFHNPIAKSFDKPVKKGFKKLVIFYSLTGCTKLLASALANKIGADILELDLEKKFSYKGFVKYFILGTQVALGLKPKLKLINKNPMNYDMIFIGTPVWAGSYASAFNTFFSQFKISGRKIALFCSYAGNKGKTFINFKKVLTGNDVVSEIEFKDFYYHKVPTNESKEQICKWAESLIKNFA